MNYVRRTKDEEDACLRDINYTREQLEDDIQTLRNWLKEQPHFPSASLKESDHFLRNYLVGCKGSLEACKRKLDAYYSFRSSGCPIFHNFDPLSKDLREMKDKLLIGCFPKTLKDGTIIVFIQPTEKFQSDFCQQLAILFMLCELTVRREDVTPVRMIAVSDLSKSKFDATKLPPSLLRDSAQLPEIFPFRVKHKVYLNVQPLIVHAINFLIKPVLSKKIGERIQCLPGGWECLSDIIPKDLLPKEGNGGGPCLQEMSDEFFTAIANQRDFFVNELSEKTDESKRPPSSFKTHHSEFGVEGSFKSLRID